MQGDRRGTDPDLEFLVYHRPPLLAYLLQHPAQFSLGGHRAGREAAELCLAEVLAELGRLQVRQQHPAHGGCVGREPRTHFDLDAHYPFGGHPDGVDDVRPVEDRGR